MNDYLTVAEFARKWGVSERSVRNYCSEDRIPGAYLKGKTWLIPSDAVKPGRKNGKAANDETLLERLREEKEMRFHGGIYHRVQIDLTYNSNHIEGSRLTHEQTRYIFETNTIGAEEETADTNDIIETANHFRCIDMIIDNANRELTEHFIKELHRTLKNGTSDSRKSWFRVGDYKKLANEVGGMATVKPKDVAKEMNRLLESYNALEKVGFDDILDFHWRFESIHPFQDGNGRIGRLIMFKECLKNNITPFIIDDRHKMFYYRGLREWKNMKGYLRDTCLLMQDDFKAVLNYFEISYRD